MKNGLGGGGFLQWVSDNGWNVECQRKRTDVEVVVVVFFLGVRSRGERES